MIKRGLGMYLVVPHALRGPSGQRRRLSLPMASAGAFDNAARIAYDGGSGPVPGDLYAPLAALLKTLGDAANPAWDPALLRWVHTHVGVVDPRDRARPSDAFDFDLIAAFLARTLTALSAALESRARGGAQAYRAAQVACASGCGAYTTWRCELLENDPQPTSPSHHGGCGGGRGIDRKLHIYLLEDGSARVALDSVPVAALLAPGRSPGCGFSAAALALRNPRPAQIAWQHASLALADALNTGAARPSVDTPHQRSAAAIAPQRVPILATAHVAVAPSRAASNAEIEVVVRDAIAAALREGGVLSAHEGRQVEAAYDMDVYVTAPLERATVCSRAFAKFVAFVCATVLAATQPAALAAAAARRRKACRACAQAFASRDCAIDWNMDVYLRGGRTRLFLMIKAPAWAELWWRYTDVAGDPHEVPLAVLRDGYTIHWHHDSLERASHAVGQRPRTAKPQL